MGGLFLYPKDSGIDVKRAKEVFSQKGLNDYRVYIVGNFELLLYKKILGLEHNVYSHGLNFICSIGTLIYKGQTPSQSIRFLYYDLLVNKICCNQIVGAFCVVAYINNKLQVFNDDENFFPIYLHKELNVISSSFLAICEISDTLTIHRLSARENLITGCSFGFDTYFNEIKRYRWGNKNILPENVEHLPITKTIQKSSGTMQLVEEIQEEAIEKVFKWLSLSANQLGCEVGLSSGYDSRLLLSLCLNFFDQNKVIIGSNYKNPPDNDLRVARQISDIIGKELNEIEITATHQMTAADYEQNITNAFHFYDGQFRVNHGWTRQYRTAQYRIKAIAGCSMGLSGHAGELLRNDYNLDSGSFSYCLFLMNHLLGKSGQNQLGSKNDIDELFSYIKHKLIHIFDPGINKLVDKETVHRYYNEAWCPSGPGIRISIENQISYYVSPFSDYNISKNAYNLVPYLNKGAVYEKKLVKQYYQSLSKIPYEFKSKALLPPFFYTMLVYRFGFDIHHFLKTTIKGRNKELKSLHIQNIRNIPLLSRTFSNNLLHKIIPVNSYINNCCDESELDRLIAFAFLIDRYKDKILVG